MALFGEPGQAPAIDVPAALERVFMREDAMLVISISGGKDSQAMLVTLARVHRERGWRCGLFAIHADLGRTEWPESLPHCQKLCDVLGIYLQVVRRPQGDLLQEIQDRMAKLAARASDEPLPTAEEAARILDEDAAWSARPDVQALRADPARNPWPTASMRYCTADQKRGQLQKAKRAPAWPDAANRYCTSDQKRTQIDKALRAPHWPSATNRYCTSHQKQHQIDGALREYRLVVSAMGMRAQESKARSKKTVFQLDKDLSTKNYRDEYARGGALGCVSLWSTSAAFGQPYGRLAFEWLPIHHWSTDDVWAACGTSAEELARRQKVYRLGFTDAALAGWPAHPAYVYGNQRVSCSLCVLASRNDLEVGARHNPDLYRTYVQMERESGFAFQQGKPLDGLVPELLEPAG